MRRNAAFNFLSRIFSALSSFIFVPFYIAILGTDAFAVISLSLISLSVLTLLDLGLSAAVGREMARRDISELDRFRAFRAIEKVYGGLFVLCCLIGFFAAPIVADNTLPGSPLGRDLVALCLTLVAIESGAQLILRYNISVFIGLEQQIRASIIIILWTAIRNGLVLVAISFAPDLALFFKWHLGTTIIFAGSVVILARRAFPSSSRIPQSFLDLSTLRRISGFAGGMLLISTTGILNTQLDKIYISIYRSGVELTAFTLAATLGTGLLITAGPIMTAVLPRLTSMFTAADGVNALRLFRKSTRLISTLVYPLSVSFALHAESVIYSWTGDREIALIAAPILPFLVAANAMIAAATIVHASAIANGYTRTSNVIGVSSLLVSIPGYYFCLKYYGTVGVAVLYFAIQAISVLLLSSLIIKKFLGGNFLYLYSVDQVVPLLISFFVCGAFALVIPSEIDDRLYAAGHIVISAVLGFLVCQIFYHSLRRLEPTN